MSKVEAATAHWGPRERWRILKNVLVVSAAFMVQFTAFHGAFNLQSSINSEAGLGTAAMACMNAGVLFSSLFLPIVIINWLGTKWAIAACFSVYMPYMAAQLWPTFFTLIPTAILTGLGAAPLWCSMCTYIATIAEAHSKISGIPTDALLTRYLGLFFMIYQLNQVWGNLISSVVISTGGNKAALTTMNASQIPELCGANFLPSADAGKALLHQPPHKIQMLVGIYLTCMVVATLIVCVGLDSPKRYKSRDSESKQSGLSLLVVTLKLIMEPNQLLLIVLSIFTGLQQSFITADLTQAFVSCAIGPGTVGYFMLTYGLADSFGCAVTGYLAKLTGRCKLIGCALTVNTALFVILMTWRPQPDVIYMHYVIAVLSGICNSVWLVQVNAFYGILFPGREEPAFASFRLFESIGHLVIYGFSPYLRLNVKVYLLFATMAIGAIGYFIVEYKQRGSKRTFDVSKNAVDKGLDNKGFYNKH